MVERNKGGFLPPFAILWIDCVCERKSRYQKKKKALHLLSAVDQPENWKKTAKKSHYKNVTKEQWKPTKIKQKKDWDKPVLQKIFW